VGLYCSLRVVANLAFHSLWSLQELMLTW